MGRCRPSPRLRLAAVLAAVPRRSPGGERCPVRDRTTAAVHGPRRLRAARLLRRLADLIIHDDTRTSRSPSSQRGTAGTLRPAAGAQLAAWIRRAVLGRAAEQRVAGGGFRDQGGGPRGAGRAGVPGGGPGAGADTGRVAQPVAASRVFRSVSAWIEDIHRRIRCEIMAAMLELADVSAFLARRPAPWAMNCEGTSPGCPATPGRSATAASTRPSDPHARARPARSPGRALGAPAAAQRYVLSLTDAGAPELLQRLRRASAQARSRSPTAAGSSRSWPSCPCSPPPQRRARGAASAPWSS